MDARSIIARLGGYRALADRLGLDTNTTNGWQARGIPPWAHADLLLLAKERRESITLADLSAVASIRKRRAPAPEPAQ